MRFTFVSTLWAFCITAILAPASANDDDCYTKECRQKIGPIVNKCISPVLQTYSNITVDLSCISSGMGPIGIMDPCVQCVQTSLSNVNTSTNGQARGQTGNFIPAWPQ